LFAILQKYDFSSKSQQYPCSSFTKSVVCDTAKVRFFKQITTGGLYFRQKDCCLRYCKSTIFQANHNLFSNFFFHSSVVCDTAKVRFFKQITTRNTTYEPYDVLFAILQKYDFSSKSQLGYGRPCNSKGCLRYCKSTIFQANHNILFIMKVFIKVVCDTAKVRFFKQITTGSQNTLRPNRLFAILQKYDFSSKSQPKVTKVTSCLRYCKSTIFQANHNCCAVRLFKQQVVCGTAKVRFFKQITTG